MRAARPDDVRFRQGASRLGIDPMEYRRKVEGGWKWCSYHKVWEPRSRFAAHVNRPDGLNTQCREGDRERARTNMARLRAARRTA